MSEQRRKELGHVQTPPERRGADWWLTEHAFAEQAVTIASRMLDATDDQHLRRSASRLLDVRLDHLERVEDACDAIIDALRASATPWVADAAEDHYLRGETWSAVATALGMDWRSVRKTVSHSLAALGVPFDA